MADERKQFPSLKLVEYKIDHNDIWAQDAMDRAKVAERLTNLVSNESRSLVISLNGDWGTGKTFLLKRWRYQLKNEGFASIYFNAWADDFCDEPLVAIIGQLSENLKGTKYTSIKRRVKKWCAEFFKQGISSAVKMTTSFDIEPEKFADEVLTRYSKQGKSKERLQTALTEMAEKVKNNTSHPLIFIIDELDRCRPTFAIELMERVKHIFDVPNIIFAFGINRSELCKSFQSIYGKIDADVYLRRFFDMEFNLPPPNTRYFCKHLISKYNLQVGAFTQRFVFGGFTDFLSAFYGYLGLSLRDIDHCFRSFMYIERNISKESSGGISPSFLSALIMLRLKNFPLYDGFVRGEIPPGEVMDFIHNALPKEVSIPGFLNEIHALEKELYCIDTTNPYDTRSNLDMCLSELELVRDSNKLPKKRFLSTRLRSDPKRAETMYLQLSDLLHKAIIPRRGIPVSFYANLIDIANKEVDR